MPARWVQPESQGLAQSTRARGSLMTGVAGIPVAERRLGYSTIASHADIASPQVFTSHPLVIMAIDETAAGSDSAQMALPGRIWPIMFDGEPGAAALNPGAY